MKIKVVNNRPFVLSVEDTEFVISNYIKPAYPDHQFLVRKSSSTESIYVVVGYDGFSKIIRLSTHPNSKMVYHYISPNTKIKKVVGILVNSIELLHNKHLDNLLNEI